MPCAKRRASAAFSPAGTRKVRIPERRTPIVFCLSPPTAVTRAVELELSGRGDAPAVVDVLAELLEHVQREGETG